MIPARVIVSWFGLMMGGLLCLSSCARLGFTPKPAPAKPANPFGATGIPPQLRGNDNATGTPVTPPSGEGAASQKPQMTPEEDIAFTDPDNPDAQLPELSNLLSQAKRGPWEESETVAKQRAMREGKALLIWFTDGNAFCNALSQELLSTPAFEAWAGQKVIRLRVNGRPEVTDPNLSLDEKTTRRVELEAYIARMKKTYKAMGYPSLYMLNASGEVIGRYRGYKRGEADLLWGQLKHAEAVATTAYQAWRKSLEPKGYRDWHDRKNRRVFAKLTHYADGKLTFIEPDGTRSRTDESKLSDTDQAWIAEQKKLRGLH